ncbi:hypothetical protein PWA57_01280 [Lactobacillus johnsonii]|uniref:hypothetical protein n=1 Tax=Lactobacillus johnsonii TaxID=33959 RepID=UPI002B261406|nr:hypothetical protein [Lactobacillus johnsonii]WPE31120.1 hypothetical protein PWA57_01280 [Lactobacillus johnsonii]
MKAIIQTGYNQANLQDIPTSLFSPISVKIKTKLVPLLRYDLLKLSGEVPTQIPSILGYGALGTVIDVGTLRSTNLINQRVICLNPWGTFQEEIISNIPPLVIPIIEKISDEEAVGLIGGADLALTLFKIVKNINKPIIIYGADSVTGLVLMQLLTQHTNSMFVPKVRSRSQNYLDQKIEEYHIRAVSNLSQQDHLVIDLVGNTIQNELTKHLQNREEIISVAQKDIPGIKFISRPSFPKDYQFLMNEIANKRLFIPINHTFHYTQFQEALTYQKTNPSRGRNLISFEN